MALSASALDDTMLALLLELLEDCDTGVSCAAGPALGMSAFVSLCLLTAL